MTNRQGQIGVVLFILGVVWAMVLYVVYGVEWSLAAGVVASLGLLVVAAAEDEEGLR